MEKYLNMMYIENFILPCDLYINNNGALKKCKSFIVKRMKLQRHRFYYKLSDLPLYIQEKYEDMAITEDELVPRTKYKINGGFYDNYGTKISINDHTPILPIVGNFLPSDDVGAYTVKMKDGNLTLEPIIICYNYHWSDLFLGNTKYGKNVFCLLSDIPEERIDSFISDVIELKDACKYLEKNDTQSFHL